MPGKVVASAGSLPGFGEDTGTDDGPTLLGDAVALAGQSIVDLGEAGSVRIGSEGVVGPAIDFALDSAIGGSQEPLQSRSHVDQAGSISRMCVGTTSCGWKREGVMMPQPEAMQIGIS